ncbi:MAG: glycine zipper 2TM domain-containing protein [Ottowia sp.]|nr:glycine zipper 2TM domain-containing protein [Ottowia sp.]
MTIRKSSAILLPALAALAIAGCASPYQQQGYYGGGYQQQSQPIQGGYYQTYGTISNVEYISNTGASTGGTVAGTVIGGAVGGLAGHQVGKGRGRTAATVAGAIGGALLGQAMAHDAARGSGTPYWRVTVQLDGGGVRQFNYANDPGVAIGTRVRVEGDQLYR